MNLMESSRTLSISIYGINVGVGFGFRFGFGVGFGVGFRFGMESLRKCGVMEYCDCANHGASPPQLLLAPESAPPLGNGTAIPGFL